MHGELFGFCWFLCYDLLHAWFNLLIFWRLLMTIVDVPHPLHISSPSESHYILIYSLYCLHQLRPFSSSNDWYLPLQTTPLTTSSINSRMQTPRNSTISSKSFRKRNWPMISLLQTPCLLYGMLQDLNTMHFIVVRSSWCLICVWMNTDEISHIQKLDFNIEYERMLFATIKFVLKTCSSLYYTPYIFFRILRIFLKAG